MTEDKIIARLVDGRTISVPLDARAILYDALDRQDECDIDMSFLEFRAE
ncbi:MAG: hypothetical protein ABI442_21590 [Gemmatimonadaceae bacterium]